MINKSIKSTIERVNQLLNAPTFSNIFSSWIGLAKVLGFGFQCSVKAEFLFARKLISLHKVNDLFVDVGGNMGDYAAAILDEFPIARLHIFEPQLYCLVMDPKNWTAR
jgi:hypothetical protein